MVSLQGHDAGVPGGMTSHDVKCTERHRCVGSLISRRILQRAKKLAAALCSFTLARGLTLQRPIRQVTLARLKMPAVFEPCPEGALAYIAMLVHALIKQK